MTPAEPPRRPKPITRDMAEEVAKFFHEAYEKLAPDHGYETRQDSRTDWSQVPEANRELMIATAYALLDGGWIMNLNSDETHAVVELLTNLEVTCDGADPAKLPLHASYVPALVTGFNKLAFANGRHYGLTNFDMGMEEDKP